jgi:esterase/lipase
MIDNNSDILFFKTGVSDRLVITFGGIREGIGMPIFEFKKILSNYNCHQIFIKDSKQSWYQSGIEGYPTINSLKIKLGELIEDYNDVIFIGNSMGGYAAIMFGVLLNVDNVIAFSPQTFIDYYRRIYYKDIRWPIQIKKIHNLNIDKIDNLKSKLKLKKYKTSINIYYSISDKLDKIHSERLKKIKQCNLYSFNYGGHNLVKAMKENKELFKILDENLL